MSSGGPAGTGHRIWRAVSRHRARLVLLVVTVVVAAATGVVPALLLHRLIDHGVVAGDRSVVVQMAVLLGLVAVVRVVLGLVSRWCSAGIGEGLAAEWRIEAYDRLLVQPLSYFATTPTGGLVARLTTDIAVAAQQLTTTVTVLLANLAALVFALIAMALISWPITVALVVLLPLFVLPARLLQRRLAPLTRRQAALSAELSDAMVERFGASGALLAALYGTPDTDRRRLAAPTAGLREVAVRIAVQGRSFATALALGSALGLALIYGVGGVAVVEGRLSLGALIALAALLAQLYAPLSQLTSLPGGIARLLVGFGRVIELIDRPAEPGVGVPGRSLPPGGGISFRGVGFGYTTDRRVLHGIDLDIPDGQTVALVGRSGAGKSTLAHLVARLHDVDEGAVLVNGVDVRTLDLAALRGGIGYLTQDVHLFHDSIRANLTYADPAATVARLWSVLAAARLDELVASLPDGLDTLVGDGGFQLSGGERQRLALARVLLKDPAIVVLDEPTAHLDGETEAALREAFDVAQAGRTTLVIAHRLATVAHADRIVVLEAGRIVEQGRPEALAAAGGAYAALLGHRTPANVAEDGATPS